MSQTKPELSLEGKVAVLTGVSRQGQVGETVAQSLAEGGVSVVLIDRTGVEAEARAKEIRDRGHRALAVNADLTDASQLDAVARVVKDEFGGVDALVNIAGGFSMSGGCRTATLARGRVNSALVSRRRT
jgi:NAD(P)-dependent dehydrogenase (short-subunit alcohol dehydrogenase family)